MGYIAPAPAVIAAPAAPAPAVSYVAPAPAVIAAPAPVVEYIAPAPAVTYAAPAPTVLAAQAAAVAYAAPAPAVTYAPTASTLSRIPASVGGLLSCSCGAGEHRCPLVIFVSYRGNVDFLLTVTQHRRDPFLLRLELLIASSRKA